MTRGGTQACQSPTATCRRKIRRRNEMKMPALDPSMCWRTDWSVMWREERICSHTGGEQKVKAEGRTGWREGGEEWEQRREEVREEGCYSHYIMNEVRSHTFAVEALVIFILMQTEVFESSTFMRSHLSEKIHAGTLNMRHKSNPKTLQGAYVSTFSLHACIMI